MKEAYGMLYTLENSLRIFVRQKMMEEYGVNWFHVAPRLELRRGPRKDFESLCLHELESVYIRTYESAFYKLPLEFFMRLRDVYPLRNKIAHSFLLSEEEFSTLFQAYHFILSVIKERVPT